MYVKIQSRGIFGGDNSGSCTAYACYLGHENRWKAEHGQKDKMIPLYDSDGNEVSVETVISQIDSNRSGLHVGDIKFYSLVVNFSDKETALLKKMYEDWLTAVHALAAEIMDRYAVGFNRPALRDHRQLLYFYTVHEFREDDDGSLLPGLHIHCIVSRKDRSGKYKLSPMTNHRHGTSGVIKSGFDRDSFYSDCEDIFDKAFAYRRRIIESYRYLNTLEHGSEEQKEEMIAAAVREENILQLFSDYIDSYLRNARKNAEDKRKKQAFIDKLKERLPFDRDDEVKYIVYKSNDVAIFAGNLERASIDITLGKKYERAREFLKAKGYLVMEYKDQDAFYETLASVSPKTIDRVETIHFSPKCNKELATGVQEKQPTLAPTMPPRKKVRGMKL